MLPDVDQQDWEDYQQQDLADQIKQKIDSFGLQRMIDDKVAGLQSVLGAKPPEEQPPPEPPPEAPPPPPEPPPPPPPPPAEPPEVAQARASYNAAAANEPSPEPPPAPEPTPAPAPTPAPTPPPPPPSAAPPPTPAPAAAPSPPTPPSQSNDWFGQMLGRVAQSGGDVQKFADNFTSGAGNVMGSALGAASAAGADVQQFAQNVPLPPPPPAAAPPPETPAGPAAPSGARPSGTPSVQGVPDWLVDLISKNAPGDLAGDADFIRTVAAGSKAESGWDPNRIQQGYTLGSGAGARGLFQFDMGGMGAGIPEEALLGQAGAEYQASKIVPLYAKAYASAPPGLSGADKASWVAAQAERPLGYSDPNSAARQNYAKAYNDIGAPGWQQAGQAVIGAAQNVIQGAQQKVQQISQFGDKQLSADEAYAACGPAAAVRFASMFGRNPTLREATDLAAQVGWTPGSGMAGLGSEKALMDKMGIPTRQVGPNIDAMAAEAQTGNPVTISTPGHYFFADGYDPTSGAFHVGQSGLDLKGGSEWMTADQMQARMGQIQGALFADNPQIPAPSTADQTSNPLAYLGRAKDAIASKWQDVTQGAQDLGQAVSQPLVDIYGRLTPSATGIDQFSATDDQRAAARLRQQTEPSPFDVNIDTTQPAARDLLGQALLQNTALRPPSETVQRQLSGQEPVQVGPVSVGGPVGRALGALGAVGEVFGGPSQAYPSGGPLAGPVFGSERESAGVQQMAREFEQQTGVPYSTFEAMVGQEALDIRLGNRDDFSPQVQQLRDQWNAMGGMQGAIPAYARAPSEQQTAAETAAGIVQGGLSAALMPGGIEATAPGLLRAGAALVVDPTAIPFTAGGEAVGAVARGLGALGRLGAPAEEGLGIISRTGADVRQGLYGPGEAGTFLPRTELPNYSTWEDAIAQGARYSDAEGEGGYWAPPLNQAQLVDPTAKGEDRIRQVIADLQFNNRFPQDLTDPDANQFARDLQDLGRGMGSGDWSPEQTALAALLTRYSQGRSQVPVSKLFTGPGEEWVARQMPSLQAQGAVPGGKAAAYGMVIRPEVLAAHLGGDTTNPEMMQLLTALGRPSLEELPAGSDPSLASFATRAERNAVIDRGVDAFYQMAAGAGQGGTRGDDILIKGGDIVRNIRDASGNVIRQQVSPAEKTGRQAWADTIPALHQKFLDWGAEAGDYAGLTAQQKKDQLLQDIQNAGVAGIGIDKSTFVPNMGFNPDYATLDLRMRRQGFGLSPKATLTRAERNLLEQKIVANFPEAESPYVAQWLPWAYMTDEKTDYRSIPGAYNALGDFAKRAQQIATNQGRPLGEVVGNLAQQTPRVALRYPDPAEVITRIGMSPAAVKRLVPGTSGEALNRALPEMKNFADQAGVEIVGKPSVGTGLGISPEGEQVIEPDADLVVRGPMSANRWFGAAWAKANPNEDSIMLAHTGPGLQNAADSLGTVILGKGSQDAALLQQALTDFSPYGWHTKVRVGGAGDPEATHLVIGGLNTDAPTFKQRLDEFTQVLANHGFSVKSSAVEPAHIEFIGDANGEADRILYGGPRGATRAAEGGPGQAAGQVEQGGRGLGRLGPQIGQTLASLTGQGPNAANLRDAGAAVLSRGAAPLRTEVGRNALYGAVGGGYAASQQEGATPQDVLKGALLGAVTGGARGALPLGRNQARLLGMVAREANAFDGDGRLVGRPTEVDRKLWIPGEENAPSGLTELVSPAGNLLSTIAGGQVRIRGKPGWNDIAGISRTLAGSEPWTLNPPSEQALKAMPNLMHMANDMPEVRATLQRIAEDNPGLISKYTQGTISHEQLIKDTANKLGMTADDFMKTKVGQALNPQELLALRAAIVDKHDQIAEMTNYIQQRGGAASLNHEERLGAVRLMLDAAQLQAIGRGAVGTIGRALNQQKINVDRGIASMLTRGNELRSAQKALTAARARQAWANGQLGTPIEEAGGTIAETAMRERGAANIRGGDQIRAQAKQGAAAYDEWIKAVQDDLKASNNFDQKTWDDTLKGLEAQKAKQFPRDATAEGQREWLAAQARVAAQDANAENRRAIAAWNRQLAEGESRRVMAGRILERLGGQNITNDMLDNMVKVMQSDDPMAAAKYLQSLQKVSWWDRLATMRYASMLSSTATHTAQGLSNVGQLGMALATHPLAVGADIATQAIRGGERTRYMSELPAMLRGIVGSGEDLSDSPYMVRGAMGGVRQGAADAAEIMRSGLNPSNISRNWEQVGQPGFGFEQTALGRKLGSRASGAVNFLAEGPLRSLEAGDSLIRGAARGAFSYGLAERQAIREGYSGAARRARVDEIVRNFDEFPELFQQADDAAKRVVLQEQRPGGLASSLMSARRGPEGLALSMIMPFIRTPWNVAAQGAGLTPLGYLGALRAAAQGDRGEAVDRAARATLGTGILAGATSLGANGYLTGGIPSDPSEKSSLEPNWQPYSLVVPHADGSKTYIKYSNLGPVGVPLAAGAILGDALKTAQRQGEQGLPIDPGSLAFRMAGGMGRYMVDQTMLQGLANVVDAISDPERKSQNFAEGLVTQFAPYAALGRQLDRALGTGPRDTREGYQGLLDAVLASYPGLSAGVPQRLDPLGRNVEATQTGLGAFISPATYSQSPYDPLTEAMRAADVGVGATPKDWRGYAMNEQEQRQYQQQSGYYLDQMLRQVLDDPGFASAPIEARQAVLRRVIAAARNAGGADVMGRLSNDELMQRYLQQQQRTAAVPR